MEADPHPHSQLLAGLTRTLPTLRERPHWGNNRTVLSRLLRGDIVLEVPRIIPLETVGSVPRACHQYREEWGKKGSVWGESEGKRLSPAYSETTQQFIGSFCPLGTVHTRISLVWVQEDLRGDWVPACE